MHGAMTRILLGGLLLVSTLAGCLGGGADLDEAVPEESMARLDPQALIRYLDNLSAVIDGVTLETAILEQYRIAAPDGVALDTWVLRPDIEDPVPVVLEVTPYYAGGPPVFQVGVGDPLLSGVGLLATTLLERGYAFGISSVRGTGNSEGCFTQGGPTEGQDTASVVEALAAASWSNGNVGIIGVSYPGTTPQQVWLEAPPSLKTIVPISGISDFYKYNFANGVPINVQGFGFNTYYYVLVGAAPSGFPAGHTLLDPASVPGRMIGQACTEQLDVQQAGVQATLDGNKAPYWQDRDFAALHRDSWHLNSERASVFYIHGLQDWNVKPHHMEEWVEQIQDSGVPYKVWLGQWAHAWPSWREDWWNATVIAWFDHWLKGIDTGIMDAPLVQVQDDSLRWRHETHWPPRGTETLRLHPSADGALADTAGTGSVSYHDNAGREQLEPVPGADQVLGPGRAVFESAPLEEDLIITGQPRLVLDATATGKRASLMLSLHEVKPDGTTRSFNYGVQSLNHAHDLANGEEDISGQRMAVDLLFFPQDSHISAGSTIRLIAAPNLIGSPRPAFEPVSDGSHITLHLDGAVLELPVQRAAGLVFESPQPCWEEPDRCAEVA